METQGRPFLFIVIVKHVKWVQTPETMVQRETTTVSYCLTLTYACECINSQTHIHTGGGTKLIDLLILKCKASWVLYTYNPGTPEAEAQGLQVQG